MEPWTDVEDVTLRWIDRDTTVEEPTINQLIVDAEDELRLAVTQSTDTTLDALVELPADDPRTVPVDRVKRVVARIVIRHLNNPRQVRSRQSAEGPFSGSETLAGDEPGVLRVTDADVAQLLGRRAGSSAFSINPAPRPLTDPYQPDMTPRPADAASLSHAWVNGPCCMAPGYED